MTEFEAVRAHDRKFEKANGKATIPSLLSGKKQPTTAAEIEDWLKSWQIDFNKAMEKARQANGD